MAYLWHVSKIMAQFKLGGLIAHLEIVRNSTHVLAEWTIGEVANQRVSVSLYFLRFAGGELPATICSYSMSQFVT